MPNAANLSVFVITRNEERDIEGCLMSVKDIADEITLVDSGSTDRTLEIARRFTDKIFHNDWKGYSAQKEYALDRVKGPWVLNIDADERVTPALAEEIKGLLQTGNGNFKGYEVPFRHFFLGKRLRFGGVQGEIHVRLFLKNSASYGKESVHEKIRVMGQIGRLRHPIDHQSYRDIADYLEKCNEYTSMIARRKWESGKRFHAWHHLRLPYEFLVRYLFKLGFLDGGPGLTYALLSSYYSWLKFIKLRDFEGKKQ